MNRPAKTDDRDAIAAISTLLDSHEARVLGVVGLFVGYLCVLFTKILNFTHPVMGVLGIVGLTVVLLLLGKEIEPRSPGWWMRSFVVVVLAIVLTAPQLYFAWTVSVAEVQANALQAQAIQARQLANQFVPPVVTIGKPK
ncbi:MAG: hypothetical protein NVSMB10_12500 [Steroidobacteraceae bacterium]